jgi:hypothetical protein
VTNQDNHLSRLAAKAEREMAEDQDLIIEKVMKSEIEGELELTFGIKPEVFINETTKIFGVRFVKASVFIGTATLAIKARRVRNGYTVVSKTTVDKKKVHNARELQAAIDAAWEIVRVEYV